MVSTPGSSSGLYWEVRAIKLRGKGQAELTNDCPDVGSTLSTTIVVPPANAARVPAAKSSASDAPSTSQLCSVVLKSMPPGITNFSLASITWKYFLTNFINYVLDDVENINLFSSILNHRKYWAGFKLICLIYTQIILSHISLSYTSH